MRRTWLVIAGFAVAAGVLSFVYLQYLADMHPRATHGEGGDFELVDTQGELVTASDIGDSHMLIFFGFTHCPDICPMTLMTVTQAMDQLQDEAPAVAKRLTPVFITLDPERDTPEALKRYVAHFHPRMVALTGHPERIDDVVDAFGAMYAREDDAEEPDGFTIAHTASLYLTGADGRILARFAHDTTSDDLAAALRHELDG